MFDQREDDGVVVVLLQAQPADELQAVVREAASTCPTAAISVGERS